MDREKSAQESEGDPISETTSIDCSLGTSTCGYSTAHCSKLAGGSLSQHLKDESRSREASNKPATAHSNSSVENTSGQPRPSSSFTKISTAHSSSSVESTSEQTHIPNSSSSKHEQPSCSHTPAVEDNTPLDVKIKTKINDLNQTFLRIINSLKIMNVHNRNSGRDDLNSNNQVLSLFDDFLNISHLLNIKINYLYNTYVTRSEMKKYVSAINYKLYVFNINSFELSQGIDKENRKHKKYQILHDLNISEMTNNVKLFNFVDDVAVNPNTRPATSKEDEFVTTGTSETLGQKQTPCETPSSDEINAQSKDHTVDKQFTKRLKRKTECQTLDSEDSEHNQRPEDVESSSKVDSNTKKLKTIELSPNEYSSESIDMFNNLFKEINNNILEVSKDIDVLNGYLKLLTPMEVESASASQQAEEDNGTSEDDEEEDLKKQTLADQKLKKWQITQMTRSLIDNMVNSIQEEMMSRRNERHERSLVNEAVLMAIQRHGLQQQEQRESEAETGRLTEERDQDPNQRTHPSSHLGEGSSSISRGDRSRSEERTELNKSSLTHKDQTYSMDIDSSSPGSDRITPVLVPSSLPPGPQLPGRKLDLSKAFDRFGTDSTSSELEDSDPDHDASSDLAVPSERKAGATHPVACGDAVAPKVETATPPPNEEYYDDTLATSDDFLSRAVAVAISKKGLST